MSCVHLIFFLLILPSVSTILFFFFFNDTATTEIYTLSLHDALPISRRRLPPSPAPSAPRARLRRTPSARAARGATRRRRSDRKSTRLNSSHDQISYAVFCLKKKKNNGYLISDCEDRLNSGGGTIMII